MAEALVRKYHNVSEIAVSLRRVRWSFPSTELPFSGPYLGMSVDILATPAIKPLARYRSSVLYPDAKHYERTSAIYEREFRASGRAQNSKLCCVRAYIGTSKAPAESVHGHCSCVTHGSSIIWSVTQAEIKRSNY
ncbi:hypothetical protein CBL_04234 [Carabus blaptoides fortunei]